MRAPLLAAVIVIAACGPSAVRTASASPTVTAEPTASATQTPAPTPPPTPSTPPPSPPPPVRTTAPRPQPTGTTAGDRLIPYYFRIQVLFPALPAAPAIQLDSPAGTNANASFVGLNAQGLPMFTVREDFVMDEPTAAHEIGHAYQKVLERATPSTDFLALYWRFRGFPGTWQDAEAQALKQSDDQARWIFTPQESWAEAFKIAVLGGGSERTLNYGKTLDPQAARSFFLSLASSASR